MLNTIKYIDYYFKRKDEYKKRNDIFLKLNDKRKIHLNNVNYQLPFFTYIKVEEILKNSEDLKEFRRSNNETLLENFRKNVYQSYGYVYYPLEINDDVQNIK